MQSTYDAIKLNHEQISPTAKLIAYWRQFADIPYSKDIASVFNVNDIYRDMFAEEIGDQNTEAVAVPYVEIRYKSIQNLILERKIDQVLEFASGISLRGLAMTQDSKMTYVETDLPGITAEKIKLVKEIMNNHGLKNRPNLFFRTVNILKQEEVEEALSHFDKSKPIAIVHEGLFQYLTKEERILAAGHIRSVLSRFGGVWVTPDFSTKTDVNAYGEDNHKRFIKAIAKVSGRNLHEYSFESKDEVERFFTELGFHVKMHKQLDFIKELSSLKEQVMTPEAEATLNDLRLWEMTV
jgi:O-methyltransferase involved in polyketide biosynthesis